MVCGLGGLPPRWLMSCGISIAMTSRRGSTQALLHAAHQLIILPEVVAVVQSCAGGVLLILGVHDQWTGIEAYNTSKPNRDNEATETAETLVRECKVIRS